MAQDGPTRDVYEELRSFVAAHPHARARATVARASMFDHILALLYRVIRRFRMIR